MAATILATVVALQGLPAATAPLRVELATAYLAIRDIGHCAKQTSNGRWARRHGAAMDRFRAIYDPAVQILGADVDYTVTEAYRAADAGNAPKCDEPFLASAQAKADKALASATSRIRKFEKTLQEGFWVGLFPICSATVETAKLELNKNNEPAVNITFAQPYRDKLWLYSAKFVQVGGKPARIAVRLNGSIVSTPTIADPLTGLAMNAPSGNQLQAYVSAAEAACPGS